MKIFTLPDKSTNLAILFDMDCTLYNHDEYALSQVEKLIKRLAQLQGKSFDQMNGEIDEYRKNWADNHDGNTISLGNTLLSFGISIEENVNWREELCWPEDYLVEDKQLRSVLKELSSRFTLAVVTNNPVSIAVRTLSVLGVYDILQKIVGLDTCGLSKPNKVIFLKAAQICGVPPNQCIAIGDRYDIDIALPLELGMGGILVDGVDDVYKLPNLLM
ncbi:MAG: HAD family hydrolase [Treponema sp.]|jgi:phosphoglycolate phosphatase/putative hydrolase of the HAD superfamily|nr:HAD family hydrolase [Treponema sp.]